MPCSPPPVHRHRVARLVLDLHVDRHVGSGLRGVGEQEHLGRRLVPRVLEDAALEGDVEEVAVGGVRALRGHRHRDVVPPGEVHQRGARVQIPLPPRGDHGQVRPERRVGQLEAHLVVALAGGPVAHRVRPFLPRHFHLGLGDEGPRDRGPHQVRALVHRVGPEHREHEVADELLAEVHDVDGGGAGAQGLLLDRDQLLALPQIGAVGHDLAAIGLDEPAEDDRGVEASRVREHDLLDGSGHATLHPAGSG